ncbi:MAG: hypothetical protein HS127_19530 [Planctomycetia bacterium]|uniref:hypothetical protein n=1 Tax=Candidatus Kuenenia sp. TaxID=2499824 RepID=UPI001D3EEB30|nr:hypothetical protein [Planctomycetia bacterium]MCF6153500.1 hypothetical protein [Candidatus Kuenenia stuttgartiensis]
MLDKLRGAAEMTSDRLKGAMENKVMETVVVKAGEVAGTVIGGQVGLSKPGGELGKRLVKGAVKHAKKHLSDKKAETPPSDCSAEQDQPMHGFIDKHKDKVDRVKDITNTVLANPEIMEKYRELLKGTSLESLKKAIEDITTGTFEVTEVFVNEIIKNYAPNLSVTFNDGHFVLNKLNKSYPVKPELAYDSCDFTGDTRSVSIKMLNLSYIPGFVLKSFLNFPFLEIGKAEDKAKLFTCHLNKIPKLENNKILNSPYLQHVTIDYLKCEEGKATVKLKVKSKPFWDALLSNLPIKRN